MTDITHQMVLQGPVLLGAAAQRLQRDVKASEETSA